MSQGESIEQAQIPEPRMLQQDKEQPAARCDLVMRSGNVQSKAQLAGNMISADAANVTYAQKTTHVEKRSCAP